VGGGVYRTHATFQRVDGVHQGGEVGGIGHRRGGSRDIGKCHDLDLHGPRGVVEQLLPGVAHGVEHLVQLDIADAAAEVQDEHQVDVLGLAGQHGGLVVLGHRHVVLDVDHEAAVGEAVHRVAVAIGGGEYAGKVD